MIVSYGIELFIVMFPWVLTIMIIVTFDFILFRRLLPVEKNFLAKFPGREKVGFPISFISIMSHMLLINHWCIEVEFN